MMKHRLLPPCSERRPGDSVTPSTPCCLPVPGTAGSPIFRVPPAPLSKINGAGGRWIEVQRVQTQWLSPGMALCWHSINYLAQKKEEKAVSVYSFLFGVSSLCFSLQQFPVTCLQRRQVSFAQVSGSKASQCRGQTSWWWWTYDWITFLQLTESLHGPYLRLGWDYIGVISLVRSTCTCFSLFFTDTKHKMTVYVHNLQPASTHWVWN